MTAITKVEEALATMRELSREIGKAKAERVYLEEFRKSKKAILFSEAPNTVGDKHATIADKENYAYSHPEYLELLEALKVAVEQEEEIKWRMKAAELYVEVWRTESANNRTIDTSHR